MMRSGVRMRMSLSGADLARPVSTVRLVHTAPTSLEGKLPDREARNPNLRGPDLVTGKNPCPRTGNQTETLEILASQLNGLKREHKKEKSSKQKDYLAKKALYLLRRSMIHRNCTEQAVALTLNSAAYFKMHPDAPVVVKAVDWLRMQLNTLEVQHLSMFVHAVASLDVADSSRFLEEEVSPRLFEMFKTGQMMLPVELVMVFQAYARLGLGARRVKSTSGVGQSATQELMLLLLEMIQASADALQAGEVATVFNALSLMKATDMKRHHILGAAWDDDFLPQENLSDFVRIITPVAEQQIFYMFPEPTVSTLEAVVALGLPQDDQSARSLRDDLHRILSALCKRLSVAPVQHHDVSRVVISLSRLLFWPDNRSTLLSPLLESLDKRWNLSRKHHTTEEELEILSALGKLSAATETGLKLGRVEDCNTPTVAFSTIENILEPTLLKARFADNRVSDLQIARFVWEATARHSKNHEASTSVLTVALRALLVDRGLDEAKADLRCKDPSVFCILLLSARVQNADSVVINSLESQFFSALTTAGMCGSGRLDQVLDVLCWMLKWKDHFGLCFSKGDNDTPTCTPATLFKMWAQVVHLLKSPHCFTESSSGLTRGTLDRTLTMALDCVSDEEQLLVASPPETAQSSFGSGLHIEGMTVATSSEVLQLVRVLSVAQELELK